MNSMGITHLTILLVVLVTVFTAARSQKVNVSVYYEALCGDSIGFVRGPMWRAYELVPEIMNLDLVPYGKASYAEKPDGQITFSCQHGPDECTGNMIQACALNLYPVEKQVPFIKCLMSHRRPHTSGPVCAQSLNLTYDSIESCVSGSTGQKYLMEMGQKTESLKPKLHFVPWININGQHDERTQDEALYDLKAVVCSAYSGSAKPAKCS